MLFCLWKFQVKYSILFAFLTMVFIMDTSVIMCQSLASREITKIITELRSEESKLVAMALPILR